MKLFNALAILILITVSCSSDESSPSPPDVNLLTCSIENPTPKGNRLLGIDLLNITETNSFDDNLSHAKELYADYIALHMTWSAIESSPGQYTDPGNALLLLGQAAEANNFKFSLTLRPIDLTGKTVPEDLESSRFNDEVMIDRFKSLLDYVFTRIDPSTFLNIQIGNEIDGYDVTQEHPDFWSDYGEFLFNAREHLNTLHPTIKVGYTATLHGLLENPDLFMALNNAVDILGVTYYPLQPNFDVKEPGAVTDDLSNLLSQYNDIDIYLQEIGYHTSAENNSDETKQATFFCNFFKFWDSAARLKAANIVRLNDLSLQDATASAGPYGISDNGFIEYLRTLGLRTYDGNGENKPSYNVIIENLEARGW